ncbi:MAG: hypothetical protein ABUL62_13150 [Myxococcales bacterium]
MVELRLAILRLLLGTATLVLAANALAQDAPVERPSVARPALPQSSPEQPAPVERPATAHPAPASAPSKNKSTRTTASSATSAGPSDRHAAFLYLGAGLGSLTGLGGGRDFERTNPALTGLVGVELSVGGTTGLGFELGVDAELAGSADRGDYSAVLLRARLSQMLTPSARLWGAVGIGRAGYQDGSLAGALAVGSTLMFVPKFGLDLSASLNLVGASDGARYRNQPVTDDYDGGLVLLIAVKAMFELHRTR